MLETGGVTNICGSRILLNMLEHWDEGDEWRDQPYDYDGHDGSQ